VAGSVDRALVILLSGNTDDKIRFSELLPVLRRLACSPDPLHPAAVFGPDEKTTIRYAHAARQPLASAAKQDAASCSPTNARATTPTEPEAHEFALRILPVRPNSRESTPQTPERDPSREVADASRVSVMTVATRRGLG
jgi:hypothetical protein